jgi:hypothetical protein
MNNKPLRYAGTHIMIHAASSPKSLASSCVMAMTHHNVTARQRTRVKAVVVTWWTARVAFQGTGSSSVLQIPNCTFSPASSGHQDVSSDNYLITKRKYANELSNIYVRIETIFYKYTKREFLRILNPCTPYRSLSTSQILTEMAHEQCDDCGSIPI